MKTQCNQQHDQNAGHFHPFWQCMPDGGQETEMNKRRMSGNPIFATVVQLPWNCHWHDGALIPHLHDTTSCETGLTTTWMSVYTMQPVVQLVVQWVVMVALCNRADHNIFIL